MKIPLEDNKGKQETTKSVEAFKRPVFSSESQIGRKEESVSTKTGAAPIMTSSQAPLRIVRKLPILSDLPAETPHGTKWRLVTDLFYP